MFMIGHIKEQNKTKYLYNKAEGIDLHLGFRMSILQFWPIIWSRPHICSLMILALNSYLLVSINERIHSVNLA